MSDTDPLFSRPREGPLGDIVTVVESVYAKIEADEREFLDSADGRGMPLSCPSGCGSCCEPFVPDILPAEAIYAATWLICSGSPLVEEVESWVSGGRPQTAPCPFYRASKPEAHCGIYPARFLVCRLFCAAGMRDKEGNATFRPCAHMPLPGYPAKGGERLSLSGDALARVFGREPPVMADYAAELAALLPSEAGERASVYEALPWALARVGLSFSLAARSLDRPYSSQDEGKD
jgi:uncharacterized protein